MANYRELDRIAGRQHGLVSLRQAGRHKLTRRQIDWDRARGRMVGVRRSVSRWCGAGPSWRMMAMAAVLAARAAGDRAVLSHRSAGVLWDLLPPPAGDESDESDESLEITSDRQHRLRGVRAHRHGLTERERTTRHGIPVTTIERTLLDLAESCDGDEMGRLIDEALRRELTTVPRLHAMLRAHAGPGRRRTASMRAALSERGAGYHPGGSRREQERDRLWDHLGLPEAQRQHEVQIRGRTYVLDRAIVELKIGIEWNSREWHGTRSRFYYDTERRNALIQQGWLILDFTMKTSPQTIVRTVMAAVEQRKLLLLPP